MQFHGSCHCGKVAYDVETEISEVYSCNCSICSRRGSLLWFVPRASFKLLRGDGDLTNYTFNKHVIQHKFCKHCGIQSFALGKDPKGNEMAALNVRCLDIEYEKLPVKHFDGRSL